MMIHFHVLRSAARSNLNISTSGLMQSSHPPNPPAVRKGSLVYVFTAVYSSFSVSHQSLVCWGHRAGTEQKRKHFYVISVAVFRLLVWSQWQAAPQFSFPGAPLWVLHTTLYPFLGDVRCGLRRHLSPPLPSPINPTACHVSVPPTCRSLGRENFQPA